MQLNQTAITSEHIEVSGDESIALDKYEFVFKEWSKPHLYDTYGNKTILNHNGEPLFAELVILRLLESYGFKGVWVDTYRNKFWQQLPAISLPFNLDERLLSILDKIYTAKGGRRQGCFDVIAYKGEQVVFAELKRKGKDSIRGSQIEWLKAALSVGFDKDSFIICEWTIGKSLDL